MADELYYVSRNEEAAKLVIGIGGAYAEVQELLGQRVLPPLDVFADQWSQTWFADAYGVNVTAADDIDIIEKLTDVQAEYVKSNRETKRLKMEREQLIVLAMFADLNFEAIVEASEQAPTHIDNLVSDTAKTKAVVGEKTLPLRVVEEMGLFNQQKESEQTKLRVRRKGANTDDERLWLEKFNELKAFDKQRRESKKANHGDEWTGTACSEDDYEKLNGLVENWFG